MTPRQYAKVLYDLTADIPETSIGDAVATYVQYLRNEGVIKKIDAIITAFIAYTEEMSGARTLAVTAVREVSENIIKSLKTFFGKDVKVQVSTDSSLVGGIIVRDGDMVFDGSVKTQLSQMKKNLVHN
jgi:F-type H+-transporting ATPase subunit delta